MSFLILILIFSISLLIYLLYTSYVFQIYLHKKKTRHIFIDEFSKKVKGIIYNEGYFATNHKFVSKKEFKTFSNKFKYQFNHCYNIVLFKTPEANWELFFHLVKEGIFFTEILNIRCFPHKNHIHSEGNVEKNYSRLNIFANNRYLTGILESPDSKDFLKWLIRENGDILLVSNNNLHFKAILNPKKNRLNVQRILDMIKAMHNLRANIYKKGIIEY